MGSQEIHKVGSLIKKRMRPKKEKLHELLGPEMVQSGSYSRITSGVEISLKLSKLGIDGVCRSCVDVGAV